MDRKASEISSSINESLKSDMDITAEQVRMLGDLITPIVRQALRDEFSDLRSDLQQAIMTAKQNTDLRIDAVDRHLSAQDNRLQTNELDMIEVKARIDKISTKAALLYSGLVLGVTIVWFVAKEFIFYYLHHSK